MPARSRRIRGDVFLAGNDAAESLRHFERAVALQPDFAEAHLAVAEASLRVRRDPEDARAAALRALELEPQLADAHALLGSIQLYGEWDWAGAERSLRRALELEPSSAKLRHAYANYLALIGRHDEAITEVERAMVIDPVSIALKADAGWFYYTARRFDDAVRICELTLVHDPENRNAMWCLLQAHRHAGREHEAVQTAQRLAAQMSGARHEFDQLDAFWKWYLSWLEQNPSAETPTGVGLVHLALGERHEALELFEQAFESHASCVLTIGSDPQLEPLYGEPRFDRLLAALGLERHTP